MALRAKNSIISVNEKTDKYWNSSSKIQCLIPKNHIIYLKLKNILKFDFPYDLHQLNIFSGFSYSTFFRVFIGNKKKSNKNLHFELSLVEWYLSQERIGFPHSSSSKNYSTKFDHSDRNGNCHCIFFDIETIQPNDP